MNIFIWFWTFSEDFIYYQANIVYEFFQQNWFNMVKDASSADIIIVVWIPFTIFEEVKALLTINYYLKKYPNKKIMTIWHLSDMIDWLESFGNLEVIRLSELSKLNSLFNHTIPIENIEIEAYRFFIPLKIQELYIVNFWYDINIKTDYRYTEHDLRITVDNLKKWDYDISWIQEYDQKYNYLEDITWNLYIQTSYGCWAKCSYCVINKVWFIKSEPLDKIINTITRWLASWKKTVYLMDQDTWSYWLDIWLDFSALLNAINKIEWDFKVKIHYIEPWKLGKFYSKIDTSFFEKRLEFVNITLVTLSQRILKLMNRHYDIRSILDIVLDIRRLNKNIKINTDLVYGFPTETFKEFKEYFHIMKYFDYTTFILYSEKSGLALSQIQKNSPQEVYKKYMYYQKVHKLFPGKIENSYFLKVEKIALIVKLLY